MGRRSSLSSLRMCFLGRICSLGLCRDSFGCFERRIEDFDIALCAEIAEPLVKEDVDLLLEQNFLDARRDFLERRNVLALLVLGNERVVIVGGNLLV